MAIKNMTQLEKEFKKVCYLGVSAAARKVQDLIQEFIREYYWDYTPKVYERTYRFLNSVVSTKPISIKGGYEIEIYIDKSTKYSPHLYGGDWDVGKTAYWANEGWHGDPNQYGVPASFNFWDESMKDTPQTVLDGFIKYLRKRGIQFIVQ